MARAKNQAKAAAANKGERRRRSLSRWSSWMFRPDCDRPAARLVRRLTTCGEREGALDPVQNLSIALHLHLVRVEAERTL